MDRERWTLPPKAPRSSSLHHVDEDIVVEVPGNDDTALEEVERRGQRRVRRAVLKDRG